MRSCNSIISIQLSLSTALSGRGEMVVDGEPTGPLEPGAAVHVPPGVRHSGRAMPADAPFRMAYFALLDPQASCRADKPA